ncbi:Hpt domain-containing protein [Paenarthrobacter sp. NPDC092416]|uniref:Hpt domain-containing protein n=1 Tax=Paenarthrobacter sp. NPDC092416 TaxID=3364386 RepID=UPI0037F58093
MTEHEECTEPLVDPSVITGLQAELGGDATIVSSFVQTYIILLPRRISRLYRALDAQDMDEAMDAVLSLRVSSEMVGAVCIYRLAMQLETGMRLLRRGERLPELSAQLRELERFVSGTIEELETPFR